MLLRYGYRLCPGPGQQVVLARAFGCARVVFNDCPISANLAQGWTADLGWTIFSETRRCSLSH
jgi:hypothetical protein